MRRRRRILCSKRLGCKECHLVRCYLPDNSLPSSQSSSKPSLSRRTSRSEISSIVTDSEGELENPYSEDDLRNKIVELLYYGYGGVSLGR